jgi:uncharacterized protein YgiM (DUF1202 family)
MKLFKYFFFVGLLAVSSFLQAQEVLTNRSTELRAAADDSAKVIQVLPEKTAVRVVVRQGAWQQVRVGTNTGWVRMMHLRGGSSVVTEQDAGSGGWLAAFTRLLSSANDRPKSGQRAQSATVGIRGFSKEDVERAELNPAELEKLKGYQANSGDAQRLASSGKLAFRSVAYLAKDAVEASGSQGARK